MVVLGWGKGGYEVATTAASILHVNMQFTWGFMEL